MNIEHGYFDRTDEYQPFPGICLVDTFDMRAQGAFFTEANTSRIETQQQQDIFVITGNPPYNAWQADENDDNKNRKYEALDNRVSETYAKGSRATNKNALSDPYVKAIRWASDRIKHEGIVAFVTNSGFVDGLATDGMRAHLALDFDEIYILDLGGNVRRNPKLSGTTHNVFGIQVGVSVNILVRHDVPKEKRLCKISYMAVDKNWTRWQKYDWLDQVGSASNVGWSEVQHNATNHWLSEGVREEYREFLPLAAAEAGRKSAFDEFSNGLKTNRDAWTYNFDRIQLTRNVKRIIEFYNLEVDRWKRQAEETDSVDNFVHNDESRISWSRDLKQDLRRGRFTEFDDRKVRRALYRPFAAVNTFFDRILAEEVYGLDHLFPVANAENETICITGPGSEKPFLALASSVMVDFHLVGAGSGTQCFPFYTYAEDGTQRRENITDWALEQFRAHYHDPSITKWDIFHYIYAVLHHPEYRERYAANLRRELPRIPFATSARCHPEAAESSAKPMTPNEGPMQLAGSTFDADQSIGPSARKERGPQDDNTKNSSANSAFSAMKDLEVFRALAKAGKRLAEIHVHYEQQPEYKLTKVEKKGEKLDYRVTKMKLSKDKATLIYNQFLTLSGIPKETYEYRLGNRSALEWVIDQYQVSTDKRSGITNDPNREDDKQYILRLISQVIRVSLETVKIVKELPDLRIPEAEGDELAS